MSLSSIPSSGSATDRSDSGEDGNGSSHPINFLAIVSSTGSLICHPYAGSDKRSKSLPQTPLMTHIRSISNTFETPKTVAKISELLNKQKWMWKEAEEEKELIQQMDEMQQLIGVFLEASDDEEQTFSQELRREIKIVIDLFSANYFDVRESQKNTSYQKSYDDLHKKLNKLAWRGFFKGIND